MPVCRLQGQIIQKDSLIQLSSPKNPDQTLSKLRKEKKYQYQPVPIEQMSLGERIWMTFLRWLSELFDKNTSDKSVEIGMYLFLAIVIIFVITKLFGVEFANIFGRKNQFIPIDYQVLEQDIHTLDFENALERALSSQQFRLATRLYYLQALKSLSTRELIDWKQNKTNRSYIYELQSNELRIEFESLTTLFEYIWYGDFLISATEFESIQNQFSNFNRNITRTRP